MTKSPTEEAFSRQATSTIFPCFVPLFTPLGAFKYLSNVIICNRHSSWRAVASSAKVSAMLGKWGSFELHKSEGQTL